MATTRRRRGQLVHTGTMYHGQRSSISQASIVSHRLVGGNNREAWREWVDKLMTAMEQFSPGTREILERTWLPEYDDYLEGLLWKIEHNLAEYMCIDSSQYSADDMKLYGNHWDDKYGFSNIRYSFRVNPDYCMGYNGSLESVPEEYSFCKISRTHAEAIKELKI